MNHACRKQLLLECVSENQTKETLNYSYIFGVKPFFYA